MKYVLKQEITTKPEIELPEGSQVVSVKHRDKIIAGNLDNYHLELPECWQVVWLEPIE